MYYPSDYARICESTFYSDKVNRDIKILSVGDIHLSELVTLDQVDYILKMIDETRPDYIMILGDIVDTPMELSYKKRLVELEVLIKCCNNRAETFIIIGNHDFHYDKENDLTTISYIWDKYDELSNVHILRDKSYVDENIFIGGYMQKGNCYYTNNHQEDPIAFYNDLSSIDSLVKNLPKDRYKIFLTHSPEPIHNHDNKRLLHNYDLILTGHYHNGVVPDILNGIVPKNKGLLTPRKRLFPDESRGIVKLDTGPYLIYNGGWTKIPATANSFFYPFDKLFNRDIDITTITNNYSHLDDIKVKKIKLR